MHELHDNTMYSEGEIAILVEMTFWPLWPQMTPDEFYDHNFCRGYLAD